VEEKREEVVVKRGEGMKGEFIEGIKLRIIDRYILRV
jgi:hypothetical protein